MTYDLDICLIIANDYLDSYKEMLKAEKKLATAKRELAELQFGLVKLMQLPGGSVEYLVLLGLKKTLDKKIKALTKKISDLKKEMSALYLQLKSNGCFG